MIPDPTRQWRFLAGPEDTVRFLFADDKNMERWIDLRVEDDRLLLIGSHTFVIEPSSSNKVQVDVDFHFPLPPCTGCAGTGFVKDISDRATHRDPDRKGTASRGCRRCHGKGVVRPHDAKNQP